MAKKKINQDAVTTHIQQQQAAEARDALATELIEKGKKRRFLTYAEILAVFPDIEDDVMFLDELYGRLADAEVEIVEGANQAGGGGLLDLNMTDEQLLEKDFATKKQPETKDSIQMYLREIGKYLSLIHI